MLTKSDFLTYLESPMHLWADAHDQLAPSDPNPIAEMIQQTGYKVEALAHQYLQNRCKAMDVLLWQEKGEADGFFSRTDAFIKDFETEHFDLYEVKSGTHIKREYEYDLAFQALVFSKIYPIDHYYLVILNKEYVREGELVLEDLFTCHDLTAVVTDLSEEVATLAREAQIAKGASTPLGLSACNRPKHCPCPQLCHPQLAEYSIYELPRISRQKIVELEQARAFTIYEIPDYIELNLGQALMVRSAQTGEAIIDHPLIRSTLNAFQFPLYFLDYESFNFAVPQWNGFSPQQQLVFQYSLHTLHSPAAPLNHYEYLSTSTSDPTEELLTSLSSRITFPGTVIVWNKSFEGGRNNEMAEREPNFAEFLRKMNQSMFDLMDIFAKNHYVDYRFHGSASIKKVLPVLVPELSYTGLTVKNGEEAMARWYDLVFGSVDAEKTASIRADLLAYCKLDTLAMVEIWKKLVAVTS